MEWKDLYVHQAFKPETQSAAQKENRTKFSRAVAFSRKMMAITEKKAEYTKIAKRENLPNAYTPAVTEYMRKPEIVEVDLSSDKEIKVVAKKKGVWNKRGRGCFNSRNR